MRAKPGYCFITADPEEERAIAAPDGVVIYAPTAVYDVKGQTQRSRSMATLPKTGLVVHHNMTVGWAHQGEPALDGQRVVFDRWASRSFNVMYNGKEYTFLSISQWSILAVIEKETGQ